MSGYYIKPTLCVKGEEGYLGNLANFRKHDFIIRLDLLQDWIHDLELEYKLTLKAESDDAKERRKAIKNKASKKASKK